MTAPAARMDFGCGYFTGLYRVPRVMPVTEPGRVAMILAELHSGRPVRVEVTDLSWLVSLESAVQVAIGEGVVEAGMPLAVTR